jgi:hypothetical protein
MALNTTPYTYLIGWPEHNIWYYGVRYATGCHPLDLWNPYATSSNHVKSFVKEYGDPPVRIIRKTFIDSESARSWEHRVLHRLKVVRDNKWLNKTDNKVFEPMFGELNPMKRPEIAKLFKGENHPNKKLQNRLKISASHKLKGELHHTKSPEFREKMKAAILALGDKHPMKSPKKRGDNHPMRRPENRAKAVENNTGINNPMFGKKQEKKYCEHCDKHISVNTYARWHGEKCKKNSTEQVEHTDNLVYSKL